MDFFSEYKTSVDNSVSGRDEIADTGWMERPEVPSPEEVNADRPAVVPINEVDKPYPSKEKYLSIQYALLRQEGTELLRRAVQEFRNDPTMNESPTTHIYTNVHIQGYNITAKGPSCRVLFTTERAGKRISWRQSARLIPGSLVALSPAEDNFRTICMPAIVASRPLVGGLEPDHAQGETQYTPPRIEIFWGSSSQAVLDPQLEMIMIEASNGFYESVRYVMKSLQESCKVTSRFEKYIVSGSKKIDNSAYLEELDDTMDFSSLVSEEARLTAAMRHMNVRKPIPSQLSDLTGLDKSQLEALRSMLVSELAIVQGPPGTGKTFTSVAALKVLIHNTSRHRPLIISAQTNHALDQLLHHCSRFGCNFIRLGGRSQDTEIISQSLFNLRQKTWQDPKYNGKAHKPHQTRRKFAKRFADFMGLLLPNGLLHAIELREAGLLSAEQFSSLLDDDSDDCSGDDDEYEPRKGDRKIEMEKNKKDNGHGKGRGDSKAKKSGEKHKGKGGKGKVGGNGFEEELKQGPGPEENASGTGKGASTLPTCAIARWLGDNLEQVPPKQFDQSFAQYIGEDLEAFEASEEKLQGDESDKLTGIFVPFQIHWSGSVPDEFTNKPALWKRAELWLKKCKDLHQIPHQWRGVVYRYLLKRFLELKADEFRQLVQEGVAIAEETRTAQWESDIQLIRNEGIRVIGCTTTGLTKYRQLIKMLTPSIMLIEEAAETREANIASALFPCLEQIILVGDHQQLAPQADVDGLADDPYNLRVSLFERLVRLKVPYSVLKVQRRMVPEIRLILNPFYPALTDHPSVSDRSLRPPVPGMGNVSSFWFHHTWPEDITSQFSRINPAEANMAVGLARHLIMNGIQSTQITFLTFYRGQKALLRDYLRRDQLLNLLNPEGEYIISTVDGYQGEENDIIILSLVRSPGEQTNWSVGFLDDPNRVVVALSRAKRGFYILGNYWNLQNASRISGSVWQPSQSVFVNQGRCSHEFPIVCQQHNETVRIKEPDEWKLFHGGCGRKCTDVLSCGHTCPLRCHPYTHESVTCLKSCAEVLSCGHACSETCGNRCRCSVDCETFRAKSLKFGGNFLSLDNLFNSDDDDEDKDGENKDLGLTEHINVKGDGKANLFPQNQIASTDASSLANVRSLWAGWDAKRHDGLAQERTLKHVRKNGEEGNDTVPGITEVFRQVEVKESGQRVVVQIQTTSSPPNGLSDGAGKSEGRTSIPHPKGLSSSSVNDGTNKSTAMTVNPKAKPNRFEQIRQEQLRDTLLRRQQQHVNTLPNGKRQPQESSQTATKTTTIQASNVSTRNIKMGAETLDYLLDQVDLDNPVTTKTHFQKAHNSPKGQDREIVNEENISQDTEGVEGREGGRDSGEDTWNERHGMGDAMGDLICLSDSGDEDDEATHDKGHNFIDYGEGGEEGDLIEL